MKVIKKQESKKSSLSYKLTRRIKKRILVQSIFGHIFSGSELGDFIKICPNRSSGYMIDVMITRFPEIGKEIFESLDGASLQNCREASRYWNDYLEENKIPWITMIQNFVKYSNKDYSQCPLKWKKMFEKTKAANVKLFGIVLQKEKLRIDQEKYGFVKKSPLHLAAMFKMVDLEVFKHLYEAEENKSPRDLYGDTPLYLAAKKGNMQVFEWLWNRPDTNKNAKNFRINTPLHLAAAGGQFEICKFIVKEMKKAWKKDNNLENWPIFRNMDDETPLNIAKRCHHKEIVEELSKGWIIFLFRRSRPIPTGGPERHQLARNLGV